MSPYQQILKKISDTEKKLKLSTQESSTVVGFDINKINTTVNDENIVEEYRDLKENIREISMGNCNLAYQPVQITTRRCPN